MAKPGARIWVVDDDRPVRFVLSEALRDAGYRVQAFDSARAALDASATETAPDLVFTDVRMPGLDGLGFLDAAIAELETRLISEALAASGGNQSEAARRLGVSRVGLIPGRERVGDLAARILTRQLLAGEQQPIGAHRQDVGSADQPSAHSRRNELFARTPRQQQTTERGYARQPRTT